MAEEIAAQCLNLSFDSWRYQPGYVLLHRECFLWWENSWFSDKKQKGNWWLLIKGVKNLCNNSLILFVVKWGLCEILKLLTSNRKEQSWKRRMCSLSSTLLVTRPPVSCPVNLLPPDSSRWNQHSTYSERNPIIIVLISNQLVAFLKKTFKSWQSSYWQFA